MVGDHMKVGELADRTGLSVRTLHHYDEIGLLAPATRTASGHRIYGMDEVRRLQQIASLRHLGLSLDEIRACLEQPGFSLDRILKMQIERMRAEFDRQRRLIGLLEDLRRRLAGSEDVTVDDIAMTIEETVRHERYYTPEQRAAIALRAERLGTERIERAQQEWSELFKAFAAAMAGRLAPESAKVGALAERAHALIEQFTGGDAGIRDSLARMYREEGAEKVGGHHGMALPTGLWGYYGRALAAQRAAHRAGATEGGAS